MLGAPPVVNRSRWLIAAVAATLGLISSGVATNAQAAPSSRTSPDLFLASADEVKIEATKGSSATREKSQQPRVVGGVPVSIQQVPWQAGIATHPDFAVGSGFDRQFCGGTVVSATLVLTAAHCVIDGAALTPPAELSVITGRGRLSDSEGSEVAVRDWYVFTDGAGTPLFDSGSLRWDIAIVELATPSAGTPIQIAGANETGLWSPGRAAYVSGWGELYGDGPSADQLQGAEVSMLANAACLSAYGLDFDAEVMVCAGVAAGGRDTCRGDSGGPLVVPTAAGEFRLVGDTSWGATPCGQPGVPGIYGRLAADPMRSAVRDAALEIAGVEVVGSDATAPGSQSPVITPPPPPSSTPDLPTLEPARVRQMAAAWSRRACNRDPLCRRSGVNYCAANSIGYRCKVFNHEKGRNRRKFTCTRALVFELQGTSVQRSVLGRWKCRWNNW